MRLQGCGRWPSWNQALVSLLVVLLGLVSARALDRVDQDLRKMYTEHTLAATDLTHIMADVIRYRATVIQALEASTNDEYSRVVGSLPAQRARIKMAMDRYSAAAVLLGHRGRSEQQALRESLDAYFAAGERTVALLQAMRSAGSAAEAAALRQQAEIHIRDTAGARLVAVSLALDRFLETVAEVGKGMQDDGIVTIRETSAGLIVGSLALALLNLWGTPVGRRRTGEETHPAVPSSPEGRPTPDR